MCISGHIQARGLPSLSCTHCLQKAKMKTVPTSEGYSRIQEDSVWKTFTDAPICYLSKGNCSTPISEDSLRFNVACQSIHQNEVSEKSSFPSYWQNEFSFEAISGSNFSWWKECGVNILFQSCFPVSRFSALEAASAVTVLAIPAEVLRGGACWLSTFSAFYTNGSWLHIPRLSFPPPHLGCFIFARGGENNILPVLHSSEQVCQHWVVLSGAFQHLMGAPTCPN